MNKINPPRHKGQSTIEYILLVTGVIVAAVIFVARPDSNYQNRFNETYEIAANSAMGASQQLFCSLLNSTP